MIDHITHPGPNSALIFSTYLFPNGGIDTLLWDRENSKLVDREYTKTDVLATEVAEVTLRAVAEEHRAVIMRRFMGEDEEP